MKAKRQAEVSALRYRADELMADGDFLAAALLDSFAYLIQAGKDWREIIDDVEVVETRPPN